MRHKHKAVEYGHNYGYSGCVAGVNCDPDSHGGVSYVERCSCGAERWVNSNRTVEHGDWYMPEKPIPAHKHELIRVGECWGYSGCVAGSECDPASHGGISFLQQCQRCGAQRWVNSNCNAAEYGEWFMPGE
jgi:hypothetical protein